jgi:hypothetical protein
MDKQLHSRFEQALQQYADRERDAVPLREKTAREQFETPFRAAVDNVIVPAAAQVKELVAPDKWFCLATKIVQEHLLALMEKLVGEGPPR